MLNARTIFHVNMTMVKDISNIEINHRPLDIADCTKFCLDNDILFNTNVNNVT